MKWIKFDPVSFSSSEQVRWLAVLGSISDVDFPPKSTPLFHTIINYIPII